MVINRKEKDVDACSLHPLRLVPGWVLHKRTENLTPRLKQVLRLLKWLFESSHSPEGADVQQQCSKIVLVLPSDPR